MRMQRTWHLVTGEYPPLPGGVSDYTQQLAHTLAEAGQEVHVWAPSTSTVRHEGEVTVHGIPGFSPNGLRQLSKRLGDLPGQKRLFVQYVAPAFGFRGVNLAFCAWLAGHADDEVWVQFHEVAHDFAWHQPLRQNGLALVQWWMAQLVAERAQRLFISVPGWRRQLGRYGPNAELLPIPSNIPLGTKPAAVEALRSELGPGSIVGHFGTYGVLVADLLEPVAISVLEAVPGARFLFIGRGGSEFARRLEAIYPHLAPRLLATWGV